MASKLIKRTLEEAAQVEHAEIDFSDKVLYPVPVLDSIFAALRFLTQFSVIALPVPILLFFKPVVPYPVLAAAIELVPSPSLSLLRVFFMLSFMVFVQCLISVKPHFNSKLNPVLTVSVNNSGADLDQYDP